jgi:hypothetical protein
MDEWISVILLLGSTTNFATDSIAAIESLNMAACFERYSSAEEFP